MLDLILKLNLCGLPMLGNGRKFSSDHTEYSFDFYHIGGWDSKEDHFELFEKDEYKAFSNEMKSFLEPNTEVKIYHFSLEKAFGEW